MFGILCLAQKAETDDGFFALRKKYTKHLSDVTSDTVPKGFLVRIRNRSLGSFPIPNSDTVATMEPVHDLRRYFSR